MSDTLVPTLTVLDVGHGSCCVISDGVATVLIDTGPGASVLEYLLQANITHIGLVVLSHADADHIKGLIALLGAEEFTVDRIVLNSDSEKDTDLWVSLAYDLDDRRRAGRIDFDVQLREMQTLEAGIEGVELEVLAPRDRLVMLGAGNRDQDGRLITSNSISAVVLVSYEGQRKALLTGDVDELGLSHLLDSGLTLTADLLVFPHHGGLAGGSAAAAGEFARKITDAVTPKQIAISLGRQRLSNPRQEVILGIRESAPSARIACTQLSKACSATLPDKPPAHLLPIYSEGAADRRCCAGSMRIDLSREAGGVVPDAASHSAFISAQAGETALCRMGYVTPYGEGDSP